MYALGFVLFIGWGFFYVFTMMRYGLFDGRGRFYTLFFLAFTAINLGLVVIVMLGMDWGQYIFFPPDEWFNLTPNPLI